MKCGRRITSRSTGRVRRCRRRVSTGARCWQHPYDDDAGGGTVYFNAPLTSAIGKALGIDGDAEGFVVAVKTRRT